MDKTRQINYILIQQKGKENSLGIKVKNTFFYKKEIYEILEEFSSLEEYYILKKKKARRKLKNAFDKLKILARDENNNKPLYLVKNIKSERMSNVNKKLRKEKYSTAKQYIIDKLSEEDSNGLDILTTGTQKIGKELGLANISIILGKSIGNDVSTKDIKNLIEKLGYNYKQEIRDLLFKKAEITSQMDLIKYGISNFREMFGGRIIGWLTYPKKKYTKNDLIKAGEKLGRSLKKEIKDYLKKQNIINAHTLFSTKSPMLNEIKGYLGTLLRKNLNTISMEDRYELAKEFGRDFTEEMKEYIKNFKGNKLKLLQSLDLGIKTISILEHFQKDFKEKQCFLYDEVLYAVEDKIGKLGKKTSYDKIGIRELRVLGTQNLSYILGYSVYDINAEIKEVLKIKLAL